MITIRENPGCNLGWAVVAAFQISLHVKDKAILNEIEAFFGGIGQNKQGKNKWTFVVSSLNEIKKIVEHFDIYPLITQKYGDYLLFREAVTLIQRKEHLTLEGLEKIVAIKASMNLGLSKKLQEAFPNINQKNRLLVHTPKIPNPFWIAGFTSGEGCFFFNIGKDSKMKLGYRVRVGFQLTQHIRDRQLLILLETYFGCGKYYLANDHRHGDYIVSDISALIEKIIPFFTQYKIIGIKEQDYLCWCEAINLIIAKKHLTLEGIDQIRKLRGNMNTSRVLVESESPCLEVGKEIISNVNVIKRRLVKPIRVQEVKSGKTLNFSSIREAYLYLLNINKVSISTISRYLDTGKSVKGCVFFSVNNID
uniref:LAGLIDADG endonuclease n=1 Tax=Juglanconis sp. TaxID=2041886 RepID=A0A291LIG7_9PEZI|nr:LAGLIDADG endonuclease [Juglanconis sp.]